MKIYNYNAETGEYLFSSEADQDPLDPNHWLIPAFATTIEPLPSVVGSTVNFVDGVWVYVAIPEPEPTPAPPEPDPLLMCEFMAKSLLAKTDWAVLPDVGLLNVDEYTVYRAAIRALVLNPVASPVWPDEPQPKWE